MAKAIEIVNSRIAFWSKQSHPDAMVKIRELEVIRLLLIQASEVKS